ncbi:MAG: hypothetical protein AB7P76_04030 [Candidatus Melainabacteria bacterium]
MITIPLATLILQSAVATLILFSVIVAWHNLKIFKRSSATTTLKQIMDDYRTLVMDNAFEVYGDDLVNWRENLVNSDFSPHTFYYTQLKKIARIGEFYEYVGVLVRNKLVDFDLLFELLPFPDKFWEDTQEFRTAMQEIMFVEFWNNFIYLHKRYMANRATRSKPKAKKSLLTHAHPSFF